MRVRDLVGSVAATEEHRGVRCSSCAVGAGGVGWAASGLWAVA